MIFNQKRKFVSRNLHCNLSQYVEGTNLRGGGCGAEGELRPHFFWKGREIWKSKTYFYFLESAVLFQAWYIMQKNYCLWMKVHCLKLLLSLLPFSLPPFICSFLPLFLRLILSPSHLHLFLSPSLPSLVSFSLPFFVCSLLLP